MQKGESYMENRKRHFTLTTLTEPILSNYPHLYNS